MRSNNFNSQKQLFKSDSESLLRTMGPQGQQIPGTNMQNQSYQPQRKNNKKKKIFFCFK